MIRRMTPLVAALLVLSPVPAPAVEQVPGRNLQLLAHFNQFPPTVNSPFGAGYASCWSYIHGDGREYAVIGTTRCTAFYNVTNPAATYLVDSIPSRSSAWHEMKSYRNWIYVVSEAYPTAPGTATAGIQIIRMTDPEHPVLAATYTTNFQSSHTVAVDTARAILICNGTRWWQGTSGYATGMRILSIANPEAPVEIGWWPGGATPVDGAYYVHDSVPMGNRLYASSIYIGTERILDFTNPAAPVELSEWTYPSAFYTHNAWPDKTGHYIYVTDEQNGQTVRVFDIGTLANPVLVNEYSANRQAIAHNAHVRRDELYVAHYTEGLRVLDISDPAHPAEFAWADTYPGTSGSYFGAWGVCPYFPSGTVIVSDMQTGLYVFRPAHDYGLLGAHVIDANSNQPMAGVTVRLTTQGDSLTTPSDGVVRFAPSPGVHTVEARKFGYGFASATRTVGVGSQDNVTLALALKPTADITGVVRDANTLAPLPGAEVSLAYTPVHQVSGASGDYALFGVPDDVYRVEVRRAGFTPLTFERRIGPGFGGAQDFRLTPAVTCDAFEMASGWTVGAAGDDATSGAWTRVSPVGTSGPQSTAAGRAREHATAVLGGGHVCGASGASTSTSAASGSSCSAHRGVPAAMASGAVPDQPEEPAGHCGCGTACLCSAVVALGDVQPGADHSPSPGTQCFVTGQASSANADDGDIDGGRTTLTSPSFDLSTMEQPVIGYWRWFYSNGDGKDWLAVLISNNNGATWTAVDTTRGLHNAWEERSIRVSDYVTPTSSVRVRFVAADLGAPSIVDAAIDDFVTYDLGTITVATDPGPSLARLTFHPPRPNPAHGGVTLALDVPAAGPVAVDVFDLSGRLVRTLHRGPAEAGLLSLRWDGRDENGHAARAGVYYARATAAVARAQARFVLAR